MPFDKAVEIGVDGCSMSFKSLYNSNLSITYNQAHSSILVYFDTRINADCARRGSGKVRLLV
jgi:hypothetical protein